MKLSLIVSHAQSVLMLSMLLNMTCAVIVQEKERLLVSVLANTTGCLSNLDVRVALSNCQVDRGSGMFLVGRSADCQLPLRLHRGVQLDLEAVNNGGVVCGGLRG